VDGEPDARRGYPGIAFDGSAVAKGIGRIDTEVEVIGG
jgi:hypothetical protein